MGTGHSRIYFEVELPIKEETLIYDYIKSLEEHVIFYSEHYNVSVPDSMESRVLQDYKEELLRLKSGILKDRCMCVVEYCYTKSKTRRDTVIMESNYNGIKLFSFGDFSQYSVYNDVFVNNDYWRHFTTMVFESLAEMDKELLRRNLILLPEYREIVENFFSLSIKKKFLTITDCY